MALFCTNCGEKLESSALFCTTCGQKTEQQQPAQAAQAAPKPAAAPVSSAARPGGSPMSAAAAPAARKSGSNSKLFVWMGILVLLIAATFGLAYVAYQRFLHQGTETAAAVETVEPAPAAPVTESAPESAESAAPAIEPAPEPEPEPVAAPPMPAPAPKAMPAPAPKATPARAPKPAPKPVAKSSPARSEPKPAAPAPAPVAAPKPPPAPPPAAAAAKAPPEPPPAPKGGKVMLSGAEAYSPPPAAPSKTAPPAPAPAPAAARAGDVFWAGTLQKNQTVTIDFRSGAGGIGGQPLPGKPVRLETFSPIIEITELPGPENGWKRFSFKAARNAKKSVTLNFHWTLQ